MVLISEKNQVAIAIEAAAGTAESLALGDVVLTSELPTFTPEFEITERQAQSASLSRLGHVVGSRSAKIAFKMFLRGTTGAPVTTTNVPDFDIPLRACGVPGVVTGGAESEIITYKPSSTTITDESAGAYATVGIHLDGKLYQIHGAVGNCVMTFKRGAPVTLEFEFTGLYNSPTDVALLVPVYGGPAAPPTFIDAAPTVLGFSAKFDQLTLDIGNTVVLRSDPGDVTGFHTAQITSRGASGSIDPEEDLAATQNWWTDITGEVVGAVTTGDFPSGGAQYNQFNLTIPAAQLSNGALADREGVATVPIDYVAQRNADAGDDEWTLVQK